MGTDILHLPRLWNKPHWKATFLAALILSFFAHTYCFTNNLPNLDGLYNYYSSQDMLRSGRWLLGPACSLSSWFCVPWCIGVISSFLAALTAVVVTDIFQIRDRVLCVLTAGILVTFPAMADIYYYLFTADGYMLAMLMAALAVRLTPLGETCPRRYVMAGLLLCGSTAIYQAYVCFAMVLALCHLIVQLLEKSRDRRELTRWIFAQLLTYALAMACYYGIWQLLLALRGVAPTSYSGISHLGNLSPANIKGALYRSVKGFLVFFLDRGYTGYLFTFWTLLGLIFFPLAAAAAVTALVRSGITRRKGQLALLLAAVCLLPFAVHIWLFASSGTQYNTRMYQSMSVIYILLGVLCLRWMKPRGQLLCAVFLAVFVFFNSVNANIYYYQMERSFQKSYAAVVEMSTRIHALDDGTQRYLAVDGDLIAPPPAKGQENPPQRSGIGPLRNIPLNLLLGRNYVCMLLENEVGFQLSYYRDHPEELPYKEILDAEPVGPDWSFRFPLASFDQLYHLRQTDAYQAMPSWPAAGSVAVIDDIIVVKLSNPE